MQVDRVFLGELSVCRHVDDASAGRQLAQRRLVGRVTGERRQRPLKRRNLRGGLAKPGPSHAPEIGIDEGQVGGGVRAVALTQVVEHGGAGRDAERDLSNQSATVRPRQRSERNEMKWTVRNDDPAREMAWLEAQLSYRLY